MRVRVLISAMVMMAASGCASTEEFLIGLDAMTQVAVAAAVADQGGSYVPYSGMSASYDAPSNQAPASPGGGTGRVYAGRTDCVRVGPGQAGYEYRFTNTCSERINVSYCAPNSSSAAWRCREGEHYWQGSKTLAPGAGEDVPTPRGENVTYAACEFPATPRGRPPGFACVL